MTQQSAISKRAANVARRLQKRIIEPAKRPLFIDTNDDWSRTIFLAGAERSGTTWLSELINYKRDYRYLFEPFWGQRVPESQVFRWQQYLRPEEDNPEMIRAATAILSGRVRNAWVDKYHRRFVASQRLVKDIRTNLMLKWLHVHFPEMPLVLLMRHPAAVTESLMRRKIRWGLNIERDFLDQPLLVQDFLLPVVDEIKRAESDFERFIFRWCIQNYVPLRQFRPGEIHILFYEDLCVEPERELSRLFAYLDKPYDRQVFDRLDVPSPVSNRRSAIRSGDDLVRKWMKNTTDAERQRMVEILALFGLDALYDGSAMPHSENLAPWMENHAVLDVQGQAESTCA